MAKESRVSRDIVLEVTRWVVLACALVFGAGSAKPAVLFVDDGCFELSGSNEATDPCPDECPDCNCCGHVVSSALPVPCDLETPVPMTELPVYDAEHPLSGPPRDVLHIPKSA